MDAKIEQTLSEMTLQEKISLLAGADLWHTVSIERLRIPMMKVTDGPNGARGALGSSAPPSLSVPVGVALAATWNTTLVERVGEALGDEVKIKGAQILLAPTVNIQRSPLGGRHFECYSEDPYLTGQMATAYIHGLQSRGVGACIKHFVCNDSEFERMSISSQVSERVLREIYLQPFHAAIRQAKPWAVMSAYNKLNDVYCSENSTLLNDILRKEWGFDGIVISDWNGTYSENAGRGGMDLEMPGPARWMGEPLLQQAQSGQLDEEVINDKVRRYLRTLQRAGLLNDLAPSNLPAIIPEGSQLTPQHRALVREAAGEAIVLLKNDGILPLDIGHLKSIAVIGENALLTPIMGGGSAEVTPHYIVSSLEGIKNYIQETSSAISVRYAMGTQINRSIPGLDTSWLTASDGTPGGFNAEFYPDDRFKFPPAGISFIDRTKMSLMKGVVVGVDPDNFAARLSATIKVPETGVYTFSLEGNGYSRLILDNQAVIDNWILDSTSDIPPWESGGKVNQVHLQKDLPYKLVIEYAWQGVVPWRMLRIGCLSPAQENLMEQAVDLAASSDIVILCLGTSSEWESEGFDRPDLQLPGKQVELLEKVVAANPNTVVVLNTGAPVAMDWLETVPAVVEAWFGGQEAGNALADVLFGRIDPSGRLPTTFPKRLEDTPAFINYPGENGRVYYGEGLFVGYRYYDKKDIEPLFPFGHGLSYTQFQYQNLMINSKVEPTRLGPNDMIEITLEVKNIGSRFGREVVQLYIQDMQSSLVRPPKELKAFCKINLKPGETKTVTFTLSRDALTFYDDMQKTWIAEAGEFRVLIGRSAREILLTGSFIYLGDANKSSTNQKQPRFNLQSSIQSLLEDPDAKAVLEKHIPEIASAPQIQMALNMNLKQIAPYASQILTASKLNQIEADLSSIE
jgi:beta-glucosidase